MIRFYLVPVEVNGNYRGPKYLPWGRDPNPPALVSVGPLGGPVLKDFGNEPTMIAAADISDADDALLAAQADVLKFADTLDTQLGANLTTVQNALETMNLPGQALTATNTYRQVLRGIVGIFNVAGCMQGKGFRVFGVGITLATTLGQLPPAARLALSDCAVSLGYDTSSFTLASTIRQVLNLIANTAPQDTFLGVSI